MRAPHLSAIFLTETQKARDPTTVTATPAPRPGRKEGGMARFQSVWLVAILAASILMTGAPANAATQAYVVNPEGLLLTLDADMDIVIGVREIPALAAEGRADRHGQRLDVARSSRIRGATTATVNAGEMAGRSLLTPGGERLLVLDASPYGLPRGFLIDEGPTGRIFVYDAATGTRLGHIAFSVGGSDRLAAVHPSGDKVYVASEGPRTDQMTITVVSLTTFIVVKELFLPKGDFFLSQTAR
jgi:DNA-binding beta-propeller fold protein YncE